MIKLYSDKKLFKILPGTARYNCMYHGLSQVYFTTPLVYVIVITIGCPPVRGDNPRTLAGGLSYVQVTDMV